MDDNTLFGITALTIFAIFIVGITVFSYKMAEKEARIYNLRCGTSYTASDFFFAGNTIKNFIEKGEQKKFNIEVSK